MIEEKEQPEEYYFMLNQIQHYEPNEIVGERVVSIQWRIGIEDEDNDKIVGRTSIRYNKNKLTYILQIRLNKDVVNTRALDFMAHEEEGQGRLNDMDLIKMLINRTEEYLKKSEYVFAIASDPDSTRVTSEKTALVKNKRKKGDKKNKDKKTKKKKSNLNRWEDYDD